MILQLSIQRHKWRKYKLKAAGGTELLMNRLKESVNPEILAECQIIPTRLTEELDETKIRIAWIHDLVGDPSLDYLKNNGWNKFHLLVFVSHWQMQQFITAYKIPWSKCVVIENSIYPIENVNFEKDKEVIRIIYTPTPHRGLNVLLNVFTQISLEHTDVELDVFSSFKLYGWDERDKEYQALFDFCNNHPKINYHGTQSNEVVREALKNSHIFAYPSTWQETSCLCLIEAMSAGLICVHSNLGALYETSANYTLQYQFNENQEYHAMALYSGLNIAIANVRSGKMNNHLRVQKGYIDQIHNWNERKFHWEKILTNLLNLPREIPKEENAIFNYRT
jgi:UDP-glucose:(glucosyl)LPS alpha-1,2-glucosyltransferase